MPTENIDDSVDANDPAAVFAGALSLWNECKRHGHNYSECYGGMDQFMREIMRVANRFETWSNVHVAFDQMNDVWPYLLEDQFGVACLASILPTNLAQFEDEDCLRVAIALQLPVKLGDKLPVPIDVRAINPNAESSFLEFRIQTVRDVVDENDTMPFLLTDEPFDDEYGSPYFCLYGVDNGGLLEHIAHRKTYGELVQLAEKLIPGVVFPAMPVLTYPQRFQSVKA